MYYFTLFHARPAQEQHQKECCTRGHKHVLITRETVTPKRLYSILL
jgi:hypothetical protein